MLLIKKNILVILLRGGILTKNFDNFFSSGNCPITILNHNIESINYIKLSFHKND